ncbi:hypothetical protein [Oerskovia turbata]
MTARPIPCGAGDVVAIGWSISRPLYQAAVCLLDPGHEGPHVDSTLDHHAWDEAPPPEEAHRGA